MKTYHLQSIALLVALLSIRALAQGQAAPNAQNSSRDLREREIAELREALNRAQIDPKAKAFSGIFNTDLKVPDNTELTRITGKNLKLVIGDLKVDKEAKQITIKPERGDAITLTVDNFSEFVTKAESNKPVLNALDDLAKKGQQGAAFFVKDGDKATLYKLSPSRDISSEVPDPHPEPAPITTNPRPPTNPTPPTKGPGQKTDFPTIPKRTEKAPF